MSHITELLAEQWGIKGASSRWRIATDEMTGIDGPSANEKGLADTCAYLESGA